MPLLFFFWLNYIDSRLTQKSKLRTRLVPLLKRSISGGSADGCRQNRLCTQSHRHVTNQWSKPCDVGGATTSLESPKTCPTQDTQLRPARMALALQTTL